MRRVPSDFLIFRKPATFFTCSALTNGPFWEKGFNGSPSTHWSGLLCQFVHQRLIECGVHDYRSIGCAIFTHVPKNCIGLVFCNFCNTGRRFEHNSRRFLPTSRQTSFMFGWAEYSRKRRPVAVEPVKVTACSYIKILMFKIKCIRSFWLLCSHFVATFGKTS